MGDEQYPSGRFGGDMDRNEVEIDLNKFMALLQEKSELKDRIRELEGQKVILEDRLEHLGYSGNLVRMYELEQEIFEIEDTIKKLIT